MPDEIHAFREEFDNLLTETGTKQLIVLIDDFDRCLPKPAIETLEAIRFFLFTPRTAFVVAADEAMIEYAVREHFPTFPPPPGRSPMREIISKNSSRYRFASQRSAPPRRGSM